MKTSHPADYVSNHRSERGSVLPIVAVSLVSLLGFAGLAIDYGYYFTQKTRLQAVVDSAALACGLNTCVTSTAAQNLNSKILDPVNTGGFPLDILQIAAGQAECPADVPECFRISSKVALPTFFLKAFGIGSLNVSAGATATGGVNSTQPGAVPAVLAIGYGGIGVVVNSNQNIFIDGDVNSNSGINFNALGTRRVDGSLNARGTVTVFSNTTVRDGINQNRPTSFLDPCAGALKRDTIDQAANFASCMANPAIGGTLGGDISCPGNKRLLAPGTYCTLNFRLPTGCALSLNGNYFVRDGVNIGAQPNTSMAATNFFIYNRSGDFSISDIRGLLTMKPATTGLYRGALLFHGGSGNAAINLFNPNARLDLGGVIYAPLADLTISSQQSNPGLELTGIVAKSITMATQMRVDTPPKGVCSDLDGGGLAPRRVTLVR